MPKLMTFVVCVLIAVSAVAADKGKTKIGDPDRFGDQWKSDAWYSGTRAVAVTELHDHKPNIEAMAAYVEGDDKRIGPLCIKLNPYTKPKGPQKEIIQYCAELGYWPHIVAMAQIDEREGRRRKARETYREAAEVGLPLAIVLYADCLTNGTGGPISYAEAEKWYRRADPKAYDVQALLAGFEKQKKINMEAIERERRVAEAWEISEQLRYNSRVHR